MTHFARLYSAQPHNLAGTIITVEVDITKGSLNKFSIVGLPGQAVEEARDRVGAALRNSKQPSPKHLNQKTIVSLAPANLKKSGVYFDVAIAVGYLLANKSITFDPADRIFLGELALDGTVQPITGVLALAQVAKAEGFKQVFVPAENSEEAALISGIEIIPVQSLQEIIQHFHPQGADITPQPETVFRNSTTSKTAHDFADVRGQELAKRALEIAAAGGHNVAMYGPPGTGKTMLAKAFSGILPPLEQDHALEVTAIHSLAGNLKQTLITQPPFRSPHHTSSYVSVIGGGSNPKPGEVTLAHRGVLFLDEFPEFDKRVIESLRQPLEDRVVTIARAKGTATFPTEFILIAALNPPPQDASASEIARHERKISGPIIDRIDMWFPVEHIDFEKLSQTDQSAESSSIIKERVIQARDIQKKRFSDYASPHLLNSQMRVNDIDRLSVDEKAREILNNSAKQLDLSPRSYHRVIKLARTIADLEQSRSITVNHILEALQFRPKQKPRY